MSIPQKKRARQNKEATITYTKQRKGERKQMSCISRPSTETTWYQFKPHNMTISGDIILTRYAN